MKLVCEKGLQASISAYIFLMKKSVAKSTGTFG